MSNVSQVRAQFISAGTATSATALATEQDPADGTALTLTAAITTFAGPAIGGCTVQRITLTSGAGDDNSDVTYTVIGTDGMGNSITEDITGPTGGATVNSVLFYHTIVSITGNGAASVDISAGVLITGIHAQIWGGRTRLRGMHGVIATADTFLFKNTSSTGDNVMILTADAGDLDPYIPDDGVLFTDGCYLPFDNTDITGLTVYIDG
jgi:hypothetical protein